MTPTPTSPRPARNRLGVAALVIAAAALVLLPLAGFLVMAIGTLAGPQQTQDTAGWAVLGGLIGLGFGFAAAGPVSVVAIVLAIVALTRTGRAKVAAIVAIVVAAPAALVGTLLLIPSLDLLF